MKKFAIMLVGLACAFAAGAQSYSIDYNHLYIIGGALSTGWDNGQAPEMSKIDNGVFRWTGDLKANEEFKFINERSWWKHVVAVEPDMMVETGTNYPLNFFAAWDVNGMDYKFKMPQEGRYTVVVDLRNMKMNITEATDEEVCPDNLYATGTALNGQIIELSSLFAQEFKGALDCTTGNILLMDTPTHTDQTTYFGPLFEDVDFSFGQGCRSQLVRVSKDSQGWSVALPGKYTFYVDRYDYAYMGSRFAPRSVLYIVGGCCELNWNYWDESNKYFYPNPANPEELVWEGLLRKGSAEEPENFKILTGLSWNESYRPYNANVAAEGVTDARLWGGQDYKWKISRDGNYRITLNTFTEKLTVEYLGSADTEESPGSDTMAGADTPEAVSARVSASPATIYVESPTGVDVTVADIAGHTVATKAAHRSGAVATALSRGLYIVCVNGDATKVAVP